LPSSHKTKTIELHTTAYKFSFDEFRPWTQTDGPNDRLAWVTVSNLSIMAWNVTCIKKILHMLGKVNGFDRISLLFNTLDTFKFLIATQCTSPIKEDTVLRMEGRDYIIHIQEIDHLYYPEYETIKYNMNSFSPQLEVEEDDDAESSQAQPAFLTECKSEVDSFDASFYQHWDREIYSTSLPIETLFPEIMMFHPYERLVNQGNGRRTANGLLMGEDDSSTNRQSCEVEKAIANQPTSPSPIMVFETQDSRSSLCSPQDSIRTDIITKLQLSKAQTSTHKMALRKSKRKIKILSANVTVQETAEEKRRGIFRFRDLHTAIKYAPSSQCCPVIILKTRC